MKPIVLILAAVLLVFAVACDDDDSPDATATPPAADGSPAATGTPPPDEDVTPEPGSTESFTFPASPDPAAEPSLLTDVRAGGHEGFDRIVFEFEAGQRPSGVVAYKDETFQCGSGEPVDPEGSHTLTVHFDFTNAHTEEGEPSIPATEIEGPGTSILTAESTCDFEAVVEWAIGVDGEQPFTVTLLQDPNRVVIDVAH